MLTIGQKSKTDEFINIKDTLTNIKADELKNYIGELIQDLEIG